MICTIKAAVAGISSSEFCVRYSKDLAFRGRISILQGMTVNFLYVLFRLIVGIQYHSVWFLSMACYYLLLGLLRLYLLLNSRNSAADEIKCYRRTAEMLFVLNVPMGGMILLMVITDAGYTYPGYVIYLSALYTFYTMTMAIVNLVRFRHLGSLILSAAKVLSFVATLMSLIGLQTALIDQFSSHDGSYRMLMNALTGGGIYLTVIVTAFWMLRRSKRMMREAKTVEPL